MDIRQLKHFVTVAETLHFGRAANQLHMTQPPLSQSIRSLEVELGALLFERTKRRVELTPFGAQWLPHVQAALENISALSATAKSILTGEAGRLELSFVSTADYGILPTLVQQFRQMYPDVELSLTEATSDIQITSLLEGKGHAGIIIPHGKALLPDSLHYQKLNSEPLIAAVPSDWIENGDLTPVENRLPAADMISAPLIIFPRRAAPYFHDLVIDYYKACGGQARIVQHAIQMQTIISLVSANMGIALVPASLKHLARAGVRYLELEGDIPELETGIIWRSEDKTPTLHHFLNIIHEISVHAERKRLL